MVEAQKVIARRGDTYLVQYPGETGAVWDARTKQLSPRQHIAAILKFGYWQPVIGKDSLDLTRLLANRLKVQEAEYEEEEHPRDERGRWTSKGSGSSGGPAKDDPAPFGDGSFYGAYDRLVDSGGKPTPAGQYSNDKVVALHEQAVKRSRNRDYLEQGYQCLSERIDPEEMNPLEVAEWYQTASSKGVYVGPELKEPLRVRKATASRAQALSLLSPGLHPRDMTPEEYRQASKRLDQFDAALKESLSVENVTIATRVHLGAMLNIMRAGEVRNQHHDGVVASNGLYSPDRRADMEDRTFRLPSGQRSWKDFPIYGYVRPKDSPPEEDRPGLGQYGGIIVELKDSARCRTTVVFGDSLDTEMTTSPVPIVKPNHEAISPDNVRILEEFRRELMIGKGHKPKVHPFRDTGPFIEAQIHGGIRLGDIARISVSREVSKVYKNNEDLEELMYQARMLGIPMAIY